MQNRTPVIAVHASLGVKCNATSCAAWLGAERWTEPRCSLFDSLQEMPERLSGHKKSYLLKWDLDITRFHTEDLVHPSDQPPLTSPPSPELFFDPSAYPLALPCPCCMGACYPGLPFSQRR